MVVVVLHKGVADPRDRHGCEVHDEAVAKHPLVVFAVEVAARLKDHVERHYREVAARAVVTCGTALDLLVVVVVGDARHYGRRFPLGQETCFHLLLSQRRRMLVSPPDGHALIALLQQDLC